jgi:AcrR family transcriptional regulator
MHAPTKNRRGRKAYKPTHQVREQVMTLAAANMTLPEIAAAVDISRTTLCQYFVAELVCGRAKRLAEVIELLREGARHGSVAAARALLAAYGRPAGQIVGKKEQRQLAAQTAAVSSDWAGDLVGFEPGQSGGDDLIN